jgi:hypothetical protein
MLTPKVALPSGVKPQEFSGIHATTSWGEKREKGKGERGRGMEGGCKVKAFCGFK